MGEHRSRKENMELGIPAAEEKWAEVLAADAFSLFKEKGIFNREVSGSFRENILSKGGTEHPMELYVRFRGHKPETRALIEKMGLGK